MKVTKTEVIKIELTELGEYSLDPVSIIVEDLRAGCGRITISCFGKSWTNTWGGMGTQTIIPFFIDSNVYYLAEKLMPLYNKWETDWDKVSAEIGIDHMFLVTIDETTAYQYDEELGAQYGDGGEWRGNLPQRVTSDYQYLCRIIEAVQEGLSCQ